MRSKRIDYDEVAYSKSSNPGCYTFNPYDIIKNIARANLNFVREFGFLTKKKKLKG